MYLQSILEFTGRYHSAIILAIKILVDEQQKRKKDGQRKIRDGEIDQIIAAAFGMTERSAGEIRKHFLREAQGPIPKKENDLHFNPREMSRVCKVANITKESGPVNFDIPEDVLDTILRISNLGSRVVDVLNETIPVEKTIKKQVYECVDQLSAVFELNSDINYWELFFKYMPNFSESVWKLLITLPTMPEQYVEELLAHFETVCSTNSVFETKRREQNMKYLLDYEKELTKLSKKKHRKDSDNDSIFDVVPVWDLLALRNCRELVEKIAKQPIRPKDLMYTYYFCTQFDADMQAIAYDKILEDVYD